MQDVICELTPLQLQLYSEALASSSGSAVRKLLEGDTTTTRDPATKLAVPVQGSALSCLHFLFKLCSHPALVLDWSIPGHEAAAKTHLPPGTTGSYADAMAELSRVEHSPKLAALKQLLQDCGVLEDGGAGEVTREVRTSSCLSLAHVFTQLSSGSGPRIASNALIR